MRLNGCDLSDWQGDVDLAQVATRADFVILKVSEGPDWRSACFPQTWPAAQAAGLLRAAYHYGRPARVSGQEDAAAFLAALAALGPAAPGDALALDLEDPDVPAGADLLAYALDFQRTVTAAAGKPPLLYSNPSYLAAHNLSGTTPEHRELAQCGLWLAAWGALPPPPPAPWDFVAIWQYTSQGRLPGVRGPVDLDLFYGDRAQFVAYGLPFPAAAAAAAGDEDPDASGQEQQNQPG